MAKNTKTVDTLPKVGSTKTNEQSISVLEFSKRYESNQDNGIVLPLQRRTRIIPGLIKSIIEGKPLGKIYLIKNWLPYDSHYY